MFASAALVLGGACDRGAPRPIETVTERLPATAADSVTFVAHLDGGLLEIGAGEEAALLEGTFRSDDPLLRPIVSLDVPPTGASGEAGPTTATATLRHPERKGFRGPARNEWLLRVGGAAPIDLEVRQGFGEVRIAPAGTPLRSLDVMLSGGVLQLDLAGQLARDLTGELNVGTGRVLVRVPPDVGVRLRARAVVGHLYVNGVHEEDGEYANRAFGTAPVTVDLGVGGGMIAEFEVVEVAP